MRGRAIVLAGIAIVAMLGIAVACNEQDIGGQNEAAREEGGAVEQQSGTIDIFDLRTGHCFAEVSAPLGEVEEFGEVELYPCDDPRAEMETTRMVFLERDGSFPGQTWLDEQIERECSLLDDFFFFPSSDSWELGDRTILCIRTLR